MSFNRAESTNATSGYWRWVGDVETMRKERKNPKPPSFRMTGTEQGIASLDHDWLLAQTRAMNENSPRGPNEQDHGDGWERAPPGYALCEDIIERQEQCKYEHAVAKAERREARHAQEAEERSKNACANMRRAQHDAPFLPTANKKAARPFVDRGSYDGGLSGVQAYNTTKRGFFHAQDTNHHGSVGPLLDHASKHVDTLNSLVVNHSELPEPRAFVPEHRALTSVRMDC